MIKISAPLLHHCAAVRARVAKELYAFPLFLRLWFRVSEKTKSATHEILNPAHHDEWTRNILKQRPDPKAEDPERTRSLTNAHVGDSLVTRSSI